jgi:O-methyltransferase involved in polyketide biosynthesis
MFGHRTTFFDEAMLSYLDKVEQVVILGAGWDTRAYGLARREGVRVYEVDAVETQTQKRSSLEIAKIDSSHVIFAIVDFNTQLAKGSAIAFDYIGKHFIEDDKSLLMRYSRARLEKIGESWVFGINTEAPAEKHLIAFLEQNGLKLAKYEPVGKGDEKQRLDGGLALAVNDQ